MYCKRTAVFHDLKNRCGHFNPQPGRDLTTSIAGSTTHIYVSDHVTTAISSRAASHVYVLRLTYESREAQSGHKERMFSLLLRGGARRRSHSPCDLEKVRLNWRRTLRRPLRCKVSPGRREMRQLFGSNGVVSQYRYVARDIQSDHPNR